MKVYFDCDCMSPYISFLRLFTHWAVWLSRSVLDDIQKTQRDTQTSLKQTQSSLEGSLTTISSLVSSVSSGNHSDRNFVQIVIVDSDHNS